jgi:hypothetical protein
MFRLLDAMSGALAAILVSALAPPTRWCTRAAGGSSSRNRRSLPSMRAPSGHSRSVVSAGAREAYTIEEPLAAAIDRANEQTTAPRSLSG